MKFDIDAFIKKSAVLSDAEGKLKIAQASYLAEFYFDRASAAIAVYFLDLDSLLVDEYNALRAHFTELYHHVLKSLREAA